MATKIVNISLPESLLSLIDEIADEESRTRSEFFREAARRYIEEVLEKMGSFQGGHKLTVAELRQMIDEERSVGHPALGLRARRAIRRMKRTMQNKKKKAE